MSFFTTLLDPQEIAERYGIERESIYRWLEAMRTLHPTRILLNRDFLLYAKNSGWEPLRDVELFDYAEMARAYRDRLLAGIAEEEPDFGRLYKATEQAMRTYGLSRATLLSPTDTKIVETLMQTPRGPLNYERGTLLWLEVDGYITIHTLTEEYYDIGVTEKGLWAVFVSRFYRKEFS